MRWRDLKKQRCPFDVIRKKTKEKYTIVGFGSEKKITYFTKAWLSDGSYMSLRGLLKNFDLAYVARWMNPDNV